jgi:hypothetical protein
MSTVRVWISMSLDGFVAGPNQSVENPLGVGGERLHEWVVPLRSFKAIHGKPGGEVTACLDLRLTRQRGGIRASESSHLRVAARH